MAVVYERQETSKKRLLVRWNHPVPVNEEALDYESALQELRGNDPRPLLVMRDCDACKGADDALLSRTLSNEKTLLFTQWFHCLKLDRQVVEEGHPWHALFAGRKPPHLFMTTWDGKTVVPLDGRQSQKVLWGAMSRVLRADYRKDAKGAVKAWLRHLDTFDAIDSRRKELERQLEEQETRGNTRRIKAIRKRLARLAQDHERALAAERKTMDLVLRHAPKAKTIEDFDAEAATGVRAGSGSGLLDRIRKGKKKGEASKN